jgi:hypothetical protein
MNESNPTGAVTEPIDTPSGTDNAEGSSARSAEPTASTATDGSALAASDKAKPTPDQSLKTLSEEFSCNVNALRRFAETIGPVADQHDKLIVASFLSGLASEFNLTDLLKPLGVILPPKLQIELAADNCVQSVTSELPKNVPADQHDAIISQINDRVKNRLEDDNSVIDRVLRLAQKVSRTPPQSGAILRRGTLLTAVSHLEVVLARLIHTYYKKYPHALDASKRKLSLADLREIGSIDAAEDYLLNKRIDSLLRKGLPAVLLFFTNRLKIDLKFFDEFKPRIMETLQRRHLLVHNGGLVNQQYLDRVPEDLLKEYALKLGDQISISDQYLRRAIDRIHLTGVILIQQCWRNWSRKELETADADLNTHTYHSIVEERYKLAQHFGEYAQQLTSLKNAAKMNALLNLAQAYKWAGENDKCNAVIEKNDWSGCGLAYKLAILAIKDDVQGFVGLLPLAAAANEIDLGHYQEWPIFKKMREVAEVRQIASKVWNSTQIAG